MVIANHRSLEQVVYGRDSAETFIRTHADEW